MARFRPLPLLLLVQALTLAPLEAQVLSGRLLSADADRPLPLGTVRFLSLEGEPVTFTVTDQEGRFSLEAPGPGEYLVRGEAPFHDPMTDGPVALAPGDTLEVDFRLMPRPVALEEVGVEVEARRPNLERAGFYDRQRQGFGHFLTEEDIDRRQHAAFTADLLRILPGVRLIYRAGVPAQVVFRRPPTISMGTGVCEPAVYVDGFPGEVNEVMPYDVGGIEVYTSPAFVPPEYQGGLTGCGVILIWTRR